MVGEDGLQVVVHGIHRHRVKPRQTLPHHPVGAVRGVHLAVELRCRRLVELLGGDEHDGRVHEDIGTPVAEGKQRTVAEGEPHVGGDVDSCLHGIRLVDYVVVVLRVACSERERTGVGSYCYAHSYAFQMLMMHTARSATMQMRSMMFVCFIGAKLRIFPLPAAVYANYAGVRGVIGDASSRVSCAHGWLWPWL